MLRIEQLASYKINVSHETLKKHVKDLTSLLLLSIDAVEFRSDDEEPFKYKNGNRGNVYVDCRKLLSHPILMNIVSSFLAKEVHDIETIDNKFSCIAGGETAGMNFAENAARMLYKRYFYVRKKLKKYGKYGREYLVVGDLNAFVGDAVLIEDLITDGSSKVHFINAIRDLNVSCNHCIVVIDREQGGKETLSDVGVSLYSLTTLRHVVEFAVKNDLIDHETRKSVYMYLDSPEIWSKHKGYEYVK